VASMGKEIVPSPLFPDVEVVALVGPSGTGKSHHAMWVAQEHGCEAIIDDGLLISGSRIIAGRSAKREETKLAAVRRAVFTAPSHAFEVRAAIAEIKPKRVLVLGTSLSMVERIVERLGLPSPSSILDIADLQSDEEITEALRHRRQEGKHVIPAPTFEVKKKPSQGTWWTLCRYLSDHASKGQLFLKAALCGPPIVTLGISTSPTM